MVLKTKKEYYRLILYCQLPDITPAILRSLQFISND